MMEIYIAGAHSRGQTFGYYMTYLDPAVRILAYLYDNDETNPSEVNGVPVIRINAETKLNTECPVYLGTRGVNHPHLIHTLKLCGMQNIIPVGVKLDLEIRNRYLKKYYESIDREYVKIDNLTMTDCRISVNEREEESICIYVAASAFDKPLQSPYALKNYEKVIQVGTALGNIRIDAEFYDNVDENISDKNVQFCELTGLYWIWKHANEEIVGLCHYRRHFIFPNNWQRIMRNNDVDVILPLPIYVSPSIEGNFKSRHIASDWDYMLEYLKDNNPDDVELATRFFKETSLYSPCNMFVMRKEILDDLCCWLFPILFAVVEHGGVKEDKYMNRYPGFISERLISFFFEKNRNKYKVVYADKNFLS